MDLEQELWRLRSVEYDLQQAQERIKELEERQGEIAAEVAHMLAERDLARDRRDKLEGMYQSSVKDRDAFAEQNLELLGEIARLKKGLERYQRAEYMQETYGIEVVDGGRQRKGWRLNR